MRVSEVLQRIVTGTDVTKNVNKNNVTHAVLFEAINLVIHRTSHPAACTLRRAERDRPLRLRRRRDRLWAAAAARPRESTL